MVGARGWRASGVVVAAVGVWALTAVGSALAPVAQAQGAATSVWDGVYSDAQSMRGQAIYKEHCLSCHGEKLDGGLAPALVGDDFMADWVGRSVADLLARTQLTMPADDPGTMMPGDVRDALTYVFSQNKFPAGPQELPTDRDVLKTIRIQSKK